MKKPQATISVVINTLNEEHHVPNALASVRSWATEVLVVDQFSDDRTVEVATAGGARVLQHPRTKYVEQVRAFAVREARSEWILVLDADEMIPLALAEKIVEWVDQPGKHAFRLPRANFLLGRKMEGTGWSPVQDRQLRFFKKDAVTFPEKLHENFALNQDLTAEEPAYLPGEEIIHFNYVSVEDFIARLNRYTTHEASHKSKPPTFLKSFHRAWRAFRRRYFRMGGIREGWQGFYLSLFIAFYSLAIDAKVWEAQENGSSDDVRDKYQKVAQEVIGEYGSRG